jgi:spermidine synthase
MGKRRQLDSRSGSRHEPPTRSNPDEAPTPRWSWIALGLAFATGATLIFEIVLTRLFSVLLWYHYGFLTISLALLGLGLAGIFVYLYPERFPREEAARSAAAAALLFVFTTVAALLAVHWIASTPSNWPLGVGLRTLIFLICVVPLFFAGLCVAIPISRYTDHIGPLYAADLVGAAAGAMLVIPLLGLLGAHLSILACAIFASVSCLCFSRAVGSRAIFGLGCVAVLACTLALLLAERTNFFQIRITKLNQNWQTTAERWNSFSYVGVGKERPGRFGWNLGKSAPTAENDWAPIYIDGGAMTPMVGFSGDWEEIEYLRHDVTALGYRTRPARTALIIGSGGGRDILTARLHGVESIQAVEVNPLVVEFVRGEFRDFGGSPYDLPGVSFAVEDGRTYAARSRDRYDLIQISAVDTAAALAAGALSLVENSLYTVEAFQDYHDRLSEDGLLAVTRNYHVEGHLMALRSANIVKQAWRSRGHAQPERHLAIVAPRDWRKKRSWGTLLASRRPFEPAELERIRSAADSLGFAVLFEPDGAGNPESFEELFGPEGDRFVRDYPFDIAASSDDRPFFFYFHKPFRFGEAQQAHAADEQLFWGSRSTPRVLLQAFVLVAVLVGVLAFAVPLLVGRLRLADTRGSGSGLLYFAGIGLGFIMVELSLIQRHTLLLGQPLYAFSGVLACILVFSGLGSLVTQRVSDARLPRAAAVALLAVALGVVGHALLMPSLLRSAMTLDLGARLLITFAVVAPLGFVMGMPLPLGMRLMEQRSPRAIAWAWGVNGSLSVLGTVLAMSTSVFFGITGTMLAGASFYLLALPVFSLHPSRSRAPRDPALAG